MNSLPIVMGNVQATTPTDNPGTIDQASIRVILKSMIAKNGAPGVTNCFLHYCMT